MSEQPRTIDLQIDHPAVDDLQKDFKPRSLRAHVLSLIHRYPYEQLLVQAKNRKVLELGCNKGYGTVIYAESADSVKAVDTSSEAIEKARELNSRDNIEYVCLQSWTLPFEDDAFDLTVLFQVIEHIALDKRDIFLREIKRVTRAEGQVIVTTPNRNIRLLPFQRPWNKFHTKEYSAQDLKQLLSDYFAEVRVDGLFGVESLNRIERRRVKQKPARVYLKEPLRKYLIRPILSLLTGKPGAVSGGASARKTKAKADNADSSQSNAAASKPSDYPYTLSDLEFRDQALHEALDLKATVLRIK
jgi:SAM-dependent methyltransferase